MKARIRGVSVHTKQFEFCFRIHLDHLILDHSDNLSKTVQSTNLAVAGAQVTARCTVKTLKTLRNDSNFDLFYENVNQFAIST